MPAVAALSFSGPPADVADFLEALSTDDATAEQALARVAAGWRDGQAALIVDMARLLSPSRRGRASAGREPAVALDTGGGGGRSGHVGLPREAGAGPVAVVEPAVAVDPASARVRQRLVRFLAERTGQPFGDDLAAWRRWYWNQPYDPHPGYATFKAVLYSTIDARMADFFRDPSHARIRLDEIDWGGVAVDGIPPLDHPRTESAREADGWLKDGHRVFGLEVGGEARAYPQRIVGWHELVRDTVGGRPLALVYCTLCGSAVPYLSEAGGRRFTFGTSGLLYRSNKLMYDAETRSLWSTTQGRPVLGPLAQAGPELAALPLVTTTWGEWKRMHPATRVLSRATGHRRDYSEGAAYREYFASDRLMFAVPRHDPRLRNKDMVLALLDRDATGAAVPIAIARSRLRREAVLRVEAPGGGLLVLTTPGGASRVYRSGDRAFGRTIPPDRIADASGAIFRVTEAALVPEADGPPLPRVAAREAFWFGWFAQHPDTRLVQ